MSVLNIDHKVLFIHVPKTGGTSMFMRPFIGGINHVGANHSPLFSFKHTIKYKIVGLKYDELFKFAFVRNPYYRFLSAATAHYMDERRWDRIKKDSKGKEYEISQKGFTEFVHDYTVSKEAANWKHFFLQSYFVCVEGKIEVDFLGRFENLLTDWGFVCNKIGVSLELLHKKNNGIKMEDYKTLYTKETAKIVYKLYESDFDLFGYSKKL